MSCSGDLEFRGLVHQASDPRLLGMLDGERLVAYAGFDATADSLHVGHLLGLLTLRRLQLAGHRPIALVGGGTAMVGDPGGRSQERPLLGPDQVEQNLAGIRLQVQRFLDVEDGADAGRQAKTGGSPAARAAGGSQSTGALVVDNSSWLAELGLLAFLRDVGKHATVSQMVAKESVRGRLQSREHGISFAEFSYMLLQAYDYLYLFDAHGCRLQLGGSDQWGNITMGIDLIRRKRGVETWGLTWPLVVRPDGAKLGKTSTATVWLDPNRTSPYQLYQYFVRTDDRLVGSFLRYFTWLDHDRIQQLDLAVSKRPEDREAQRTLAREVTALVHGEAEAARAEKAADSLFGGDISSLEESSLLDVFGEAPSSSLAMTALDGEGVSLAECLVSAGLVRSRSSARATISQGGAYINLKRQAEDRPLGRDDLLAGRYVVLSRGKKEHHLLRFG